MKKISAPPPAKRNGGNEKKSIFWEKIGLSMFGMYIAYLLYISNPSYLIITIAFIVVYNSILWLKEN